MRIGKVSIVGKPNVGKSTLINQIFKKEVVISTHKPQTTRNQISLLYQDIDSQIIINDTPGYHTPKNKLDLFLNSQVKKALKNIDVIVFLFDAKRDYDDEDRKILDQIKSFKYGKLILAINKSDDEDAVNIENIKKQITKDYVFDKIFCISALYNEYVNELIDYIKSQLIESEEPLVTNSKELEQKEEFVVSEIIRRIILNKFRQEIPHSTAVVVEKMEYSQEKNLLLISFSIVVEKESQKPIIIGKGGSSIKDIGIYARKELSEIYDCKIFLESNVKVRKNWRDNDTMIKELGYKK